MKTLLITVGIPAYNEEKNIAKVIVKLQKIADRIIVCDDGSSDMTSDIAERLGAIVIKHQKNMGYGAAIGSLFLKAKETNSDILVTLDADGQHKAEDVKLVLEPILNGKADIAIGSRFLEKNQSNIPPYRRAGIKAITKLANTSLENKITDSQSGFRAYNKRVLAEIVPSDYGMGVSNEILIKASKKSFKIQEVPITVLYEGDTSTHHPVSHGISVILSTMKFISIEHPLKFYGLPGALFLGIGLYFIVWTIQAFGENGRIITNISILGIGITIFGMILMMTAIMLYSMVNIVREHKT